MALFVVLVVIAFAAAVQTLTGQVGAWLGWWPTTFWLKDLVAGWAGAIVGYGLLGVWLWWCARRSTDSAEGEERWPRC